ncbi:MAG: YaiI/YqxD family protein [Rhodospirillales bacterium]|nr:YaiI/YqxD family protein [Rhodospirillales bacterium]
MLDIYVDGDACPVKDEVFRVAARHMLKVYLVSNSWLRIGDSPLVEQIVVSQGADVADDWIADHIGEGDIFVTSDIPLAARCVKNHAIGLAPNGKPFTPDSIGMALAMRDLMTDLRDTGEISGGGNASFTRQDRSRFLSELETQIQAIKRR